MNTHPIKHPQTTTLSSILPTLPTLPRIPLLSLLSLITITILLSLPPHISPNIYNINNTPCNHPYQKSCNTSRKLYSLAIVAVFSNEEHNLEEWLNFHINQGFEQFFLYNNDKDLRKYPYLQDLPSSKYSNYITLTDFTSIKSIHRDDMRLTIQSQAYDHCVVFFSHLTQFLLVSDIDEYTHAYNEFPTVAEYVYSLDWDSVKSLKIQRYDYGSNGFVSRPGVPAYEAYLKHEKNCVWWKAMANTDYVDKQKRFIDAHDFNYKESRKVGKTADSVEDSGNTGNTGKDGNDDAKAEKAEPIVYNDYLSYEYDSNGNFVGFFTCPDDAYLYNTIPLVMSHYATRSKEEYMEKCLRWQRADFFDRVNTAVNRRDCSDEGFMYNDKRRSQVEGFEYMNGNDEYDNIEFYLYDGFNDHN